MEFSNDFLASITEFEGSTDWMYLDTAGNVTAGVGHLIASPQRAMTLSFEGGDPFQDWINTRKATPGKIAGYYQRYSTCRLTPLAVTTLLQSDLEAAAGQLEARLQYFPGLPQRVQEALCDMAFNLGSAKLLDTYPTLLKCVEAADWQGAAAACRRHGISQKRNDWCAAMFGVAGGT